MNLESSVVTYSKTLLPSHPTTRPTDDSIRAVSTVQAGADGKCDVQQETGSGRNASRPGRGRPLTRAQRPMGEIPCAEKAVSPLLSSPFFSRTMEMAGVGKAL
jgi:hypothetical protein